jgi:uncharacterized phiE125 gp8 family phage protein
VSALVQYAAPAEEPLTVAQVQAHCRIDASNQEPAPGVIAVALATAAGNVNAGAHRYLATFVTAAGETQAGTISAAVTTDGAHGQVALSAIPIGGAMVTARKLYRTAAGGAVYLLLATIANNTATTYTDNIADASLGAQAPSVNTTEDWFLNLLIRSARIAAERITKRALVTQTWDLYLDRFPAWEQYIPLPKTQSVASVKYIDTNGAEQTLAADQYLVDTKSEPGRIAPAFGLIWPVTRWQTNAVTIRFTCGYGGAADVSDGIKNWMLMRIKTLWDNRSEISVDTRITLVELPPEFVDGLLDDYTVDSYCWALEV